MTRLKNRAIKKYVKKQDGATAIEFGLLALPFFFLILGTIELSLFYASGVMLEGAATSASRVIRTGQAQESADPQSAFEQVMCDKAGAVISCDEIVYEAINLGDSFTGASSTPPNYDSDGNMVSSGFDAGGSEDVIMVRLSYRHQFFSPLLGPYLGDDTGTNSALHTSTVVLRTEPYRF
jgi:Flp pilus assembly protein TadG